MAVGNEKVKRIVVRMIGPLIMAYAMYVLVFGIGPKTDALPIADTTSFRGVVRSIDLGRGAKMQVEGDPRTFDIRGIYRDTISLCDYMTWGDTIEKLRGLRTVLLHRKGSVTIWKIDESER